MRFSGFILLVILVMASNIKVDGGLAPLGTRTPIEEPQVLKAVAPVFIPFVFGESGTAEGKNFPSSA